MSATVRNNPSAPIGPDSITELGMLWQKRLRLQDWDVEYRVCHAYEFENPADMGDCEQCVAMKCARIRIANPDEWDHSRVMKYDTEQTIVHELLHLTFYDAPGACSEHDERAINQVATALVALSRGQV